MSQDSRADLYARTVERLASKPGLRAKIDAKCAECTYDPYQQGTWRFQVENCTSFGCPLFEVRPCRTMSVRRKEVSDEQE